MNRNQLSPVPAVRSLRFDVQPDRLWIGIPITPDEARFIRMVIIGAIAFAILKR